MDNPNLLALAVVFFAFAASPGPDNMTIVARTISHGAAWRHAQADTTAQPGHPGWPPQ